ncbi:MAG: dephospho-CoA kinase [Flavobacteriales bacterium]
MRKVAVTGGIGSGKSMVCRMFQVLGIPVFEADRVAKQLMLEDAALRGAITERFGASVLGPQGLDRQALAGMVFQDPAALADLNALVHPKVRKAFADWADAQQAPYVIMEAAILAETGGHTAFDHVILVSAPKEIRLARAMARDGVGEEAVLARMSNQASDVERNRIANDVVVNDDANLVIPQVLAIHKRLLS